MVNETVASIGVRSCVFSLHRANLRTNNAKSLNVRLVIPILIKRHQLLVVVQVDQYRNPQGQYASYYKRHLQPRFPTYPESKYETAAVPTLNPSNGPNWTQNA